VRAPLNPVLARELRVRLRSGRAWLLLTVYLVLLGAICFLVYEAESGGGSSPFSDPFSPPSPTQFAAVGRSIFEWLVFFMLLLVLFLVPGLTSGALAGERERQTLVPLQVTLLRPWQIVVGKLGASFAFLALLVLATAPLLSIAYLIGGVTAGTVVKGLGLVLFTGLTTTCLTLLVSGVFRRVQGATVAAYSLMLVLTLGSFLVWVGAGILDESRGNDPANPPSFLLATNPLFAAADVLGEDDVVDVGGGLSSPFQPLEEALLRSRYENFGGGFGGGPFPIEDVGFRGGVAVGFGSTEDGGRVIGFDRFGRPIFDDDEGWPFWATSVITLYVLAVAGASVAVWRLRSPAKVER
jgi:ABC-type transport system involved in multi-copper enzyme maturation permease subunit